MEIHVEGKSFDPRYFGISPSKLNHLDVCLHWFLRHMDSDDCLSENHKLNITFVIAVIFIAINCK